MTATPQGRPPEVGSTFGPYRIDGVVGVGGMGMVYTATDLRLGRQVAVKVVLGHFADSPEFLQRFQREAAVLARLDSPHVIAIYDHGEHEGWPYLVTRYAAGGDLGRLLRAHGALHPPLAALVCAQVADALVDAHSVGVVHRDVKPANVLLRDDRLDRLHVYLCDFGVAAVEASGLTTPGSVAGTWNYLAPERAQGAPGTPASDVYSVGCLLFETLTGRPPYRGTDVEVAMAHLHEPVPQLPGDDAFTWRANLILARSMAKDPAQRFGSARELRDQLRTIGGTAMPAAPTPAPGGRRGRRSGRRLAVAGLVGAVVIAVGVAASLVWWPSGGEDPGEPTSTADPRAGTVVTGDVDDNGFGDIAVGTYEHVYELYSTGAAFKEPKEEKDISTPVVWGDVDNDGQLDLIEVDGRPPRVTVEVHYPDRSTQAYLFETPEGTQDSAIPMAGDFDGDGTSDVAMATQARGGDVTVSTALSEGEPGLGAAEQWHTMSDVSEDDDIEFVVGDFDGDDVDDLVTVHQEVSGPTHVQMLASTGDGFEPAGEAWSPEDFEYFYGVMRGGDFDGDGVDELAVVQDVANIDIYRWREDAFDAPEAWRVAEDRPGTTTNVTVTDLDGDSDDDLAVVLNNADPGSSTIRVLRSDGERFEPDSSLDQTLPLSYPDAVDRVNWD